jgi:hypothetical protein
LKAVENGRVTRWEIFFVTLLLLWKQKTRLFAEISGFLSFTV